MCPHNCTVKYTAMLEDGTVFEKKGLDGLDPMKFVTDEGEWICIIPFFLDLCRAFMQQNKKHFVEHS